MINPYQRIWFISSMLAVGLATSADPFLNLDFEKANVPGVPIPWVFERPEVALPGWDLTFVGGGPVGSMLVGGTPLGSGFALLAHRSAAESYVIQGRYSLVLGPGFLTPLDPPSEIGNYSLSQTADVPGDAKSLRFQAMYGQLEVEMNGAPLQLIDEAPDDLWFAADIRSFAGSTAKLEFITHEVDNPLGLRIYVLDTVQFSNSPIIPETSPRWIASVGLGILWWVSRSRQQ